MATRGQVWQQALNRVDPCLLAGPLGDRAEKRPSRSAIKQLWPTVFARLTPVQRTRLDAFADSEDERLIEAAVAERADDLRTLHGLATRARELIARDRHQPDVAHLTRQGREQTAMALSVALSAWKQQTSADDAYHAYRARHGATSRDTPATSLAVRAYLERHREKVRRRLARCWEARPDDTPREEPAPSWPPVGSLPPPWEEPTEAQLGQVRALLDHTGAARTAYELRLRGGPTPSCPPVLTTDHAARPLDRSLWARLVRGTYGDPPDTIGTVIDQEISRACRPLGLGLPSGETVLVTGCLMMRSPVDTETASLRGLLTGGDSIDARASVLARIGFSVRRHLGRALGWGRFEHLAEHVAQRLTDPLDDFSATVWTRLHSWERDHNPRSGTSAAISAAYRSWLWNLTRPPRAGSGRLPVDLPLADDPAEASSAEVLADLARAEPLVQSTLASALRGDDLTAEAWAEVVRAVQPRPCPTYEQVCRLVAGMQETRDA